LSMLHDVLLTPQITGRVQPRPGKKAKTEGAPLTV
jgi:hypothetical protein